ncbi:MAG: hypothetical protein IMZ70_07950 [Candidatus Atribacteria bacterium]|nr:hypothetical protein [Candidatus Atribacteria bacterium]MBE3145036.1 hypothetical protein [Planctomycetota bacterium]
MEKTITKHIAARTEKIIIIGGRKSFLHMSQKYRAIRSDCRNSMDKCFLCKHAFVDGEMMGLVMIKGTTNKVICHPCWDKHELG